MLYVGSLTDGLPLPLAQKAVYVDVMPKLNYWTAKGQLISECLFDFLNFPKTQEKFDKFLPQNLESSQIIE